MSDATPWTVDHRALYALMAAVSEECYCAGWMMGNEFALWRILIDPTGNRQYGQSEVTGEQVADMRVLSDRIGGWIGWYDDGDEPGLPSEEWGPRFIPRERWDEMYARHEAA